MSKPKILLLDIETSPILADVWQLWDNNVGLNQIRKDWQVISWSAKWLGEKEIFYQDLRGGKKLKSDKKILKSIWKLINKADIVIGHNSKKFDIKKLNARFKFHKMKPPSSFKHIDTFIIAKRHFCFTSNKLEHLCEFLDVKHKKLVDRKYVGHSLWVECCVKGNLDAWQDMEKYNKQDVKALEDVYNELIPWDNSINFNLYSDSTVTTCTCGSTDFSRNGHAYTASGKFQRFTCKKCGSEVRGKTNVLSKEKKNSLKNNVVR